MDSNSDVDHAGRSGMVTVSTSPSRRNAKTARQGLALGNARHSFCKQLRTADRGEIPDLYLKPGILLRWAGAGVGQLIGAGSRIRPALSSTREATPCMPRNAFGPW
jgi:hypothetical protein